MIAKKITYTDYNEIERTETFYFNLNKAELIEMDFETTGGLQQLIERITAAQDNREIMRLMKQIICKSYGVKSADGKRLIKDEEHLNAFLQSEAYSEFLYELMTVENAAVKFIEGIVPVLPEDHKAVLN